MSLQWYPGHMTKARRELAALIPSQDVIIEVLDARLPRASSNPVITELRRDKPCIKVLSKSDLADPAVTRAWVEHLGRDPTVRAFAASTTTPGETRTRIAALSRGLAAHRGADKPVRALISGVPNVGKSTLINVLMKQAVAKVADKPAVTKAQQRVVMASGMTLTDSPGLMWPKIEDEQGAFLLAVAGSIPETALDYHEIGMFAAGRLLRLYPALVVKRYKLDAVPTSAEDLLHEIGRRRAGLRAGGAVDLHKAAEVLVHDFRSGALGRISLEAPRAPGPAPARAASTSTTPAADDAPADDGPAHDGPDDDDRLDAHDAPDDDAA
ncbi:MAG: ribosome biogenesis GTPase YlqF [Kofleriaceae bacterium]|nr:ribosome biogenesis GTPase YlqF [Kofleriaceae bacterium]